MLETHFHQQIPWAPLALRAKEEPCGNSAFSQVKSSEVYMKRIFRKAVSIFRQPPRLLTIIVALFLATPVFAQTGTSPWENAVSVLQTAFTSTIARGLSLVAIVVAGLTFAFGEGGSKRVLAGVLFGVGMAIAAVNFLSWLFPGS
jgi:type IV secretory pathway VirB2 component (pilin)